ncbi:Regulatory protein RecX [Macleaya cordata]|uniref:Regulatory protein RecX n=1 Tax=Macleaya cordata TaxID=56857 RepID=A0A200RAJ8_MACCD|nr:Regulatory protein RecX [Macleaya cordata]
MAIFAGNLSFKISIQLRSRVLLTPWVKKTSFIRCCGDYPTSGPVRYIPKKYSNFEERKRQQPDQNSEKAESDNYSDSIPLRNRASEGRSNFDKRPQNGVSYLSKAETVQSSNMIGNVDLELEDEGEYEQEDFIGVPGIPYENDNDHCEGDRKQPSKNKQDAERIAIEALAKRAFTTLELRKKLHAKRIPLDIIERVLNDFQSRGLIDDYLYAETFSRSRWSSSTWGPRRIKQALLQKGVSVADAEKAMKHVFEEDDYGGEKEPSLGMSKISMDHLYVQASKQWLRGQDVPLDKRKSRMIRWLQYRGFNWGVTSFILKKLESQNPP